jgi:CheY-like chemotaxis protein
VNRPLLLVVDDDCEVRELIRSALEPEEYEVACCPDGREALRFMREERRPALVLLDLMMPVMNGWELVEELRGDPELASIPVLVLTAAGTHWGYPVPRERVLEKPFPLETLLEHIDAALHARLPAEPARAAGLPIERA